MMRRIHACLAFPAAALLLAGCDPFVALAPLLQPAIELASFKAPATAKRGAPVTITLRRSGGDCDTLVAGTKVDEATKMVSFWGQVDKPAGPCTTGISCLNTTVTFTPAQAGTYMLKARVWAPSEVEGTCGSWESMAPTFGTPDARGLRDVYVKLAVTE